MTIQDSSPERRNLLVLSISIIIFYLAGGQFIDQSVKLQIINVKFSNPEVLKHFIWILLLWFTFRYWVTQKNSWQVPFQPEIRNVILSTRHHNYIKKILDNNEVFPNEDYIISYLPQQGFFFNRIRGKNTSTTYGKNAKLSGVRDFLIFLETLFHVLIKKPTLTTHAVPYFLAVWAIGLILCNSYC